MTTMRNPYRLRDKQAFWKNGVQNSDITFPEKIYSPKWKIGDTDKIATMGSCFAQHIAKWLRENGFNVPFYETSGFNEKEQMFSANYGNVYTVRQALQLVQESIGERTPSEIAWSDGNRFIDALRPNSIAEGFSTVEDTLAARKIHLNSIREMVKDFDVLILTLGLTEAWEIKSCGTIVPTAPGVLAGDFDPDRYRFLNFGYTEILEDLYKLCDLLRAIRQDRPFKLLLTVSPVPLTATATNQHVLLASTYSKAVLRSIAGDFASHNEFAEYFPSFEIINNPAAHSSFFEDNLRSVKKSAVENVMNVFSSSALETPREFIKEDGTVFDATCEDALLDEFSKVSDSTEPEIVCVGASHLASLRAALIPKLTKTSYFFPTNWGKMGWAEFDKNNYLTHFLVKNEYKHLINEVFIREADILIMIGLGLGGDDIIRCHGLMGRDFSPKVPIKYVVDRKLMEFYRSRLVSKINLIRKLDEGSTYKKIFWVFGPDMCVDVARFRLGDEFVNSGSYLIHKEAYNSVFNEYIHNFKKVKFITHDSSLCDPNSGFSLNTYQLSDNLFDIHCNEQYYEPVVYEILDYIKV